MKRILSIVCLLALTSISCIQNKQEASAYLIDPTLNEIQNQFLNNQAEALLSQANNVFYNHPPDWPEPIARASAFYSWMVSCTMYILHRDLLYKTFKKIA